MPLLETIDATADSASTVILRLREGAKKSRATKSPCHRLSGFVARSPFLRR